MIKQAAVREVMHSGLLFVQPAMHVSNRIKSGIHMVV